MGKEHQGFMPTMPTMPEGPGSQQRPPINAGDPAITKRFVDWLISALSVFHPFGATGEGNSLTDHLQSGYFDPKAWDQADAELNPPERQLPGKPA